MLWTVLFLLTVLLNSWLFWLLTRQSCSTQSRDANTTTPEDIFIAIVVMLVLISWLGLLLAELGLFSLAALTGTLLVVALGLIVWLRWRQVTFRPPTTLRLDRFDAMALFVALFIALLYARPSEWIGGGDDPAVYVSIGVNIARTGSILIHDQTLDDIDPEQMQVLFYIPGASHGHEGILFPGIYVQNRDRGMLVPQFFHVFPVWIAILYSIGGIGLAMFATPLFGWLSVITIYLIGRRLIHPGAGVLAMTLLGLNISQLWFSRVPFADVVLQFCLLGGFWTLALLVERIEREHPATIPIALLSGACFGLCHLVKVDAFVVPVVVLGFVAYNWLMGMLRRSHVCFLGAYVLLTVHAVLHGYLFSLPYIIALFTEYSNYIQLAQKGSIIILPLLLLIAWQRARVARFLTDLAQHREKLGQIFALCVLLLSLYAYFVRPLRADLGAMSEVDWAGKGTVINWLRPLATAPATWNGNGEPVRTFVEEGIVRLGWYLTPLGVCLGIAGFVYWGTTKLTLKSAPLLGGAFVGAIIAFYRGAIMARYFWAFKRYVPLVVPTFVLFIAFLLYRLWPTDRSRWQGAILPLFAACFLLASFTGGSMMFWEHVEFEGAIEDIDTLSNSLPEDSVLLFDFSHVGLRLSLPMTYLHGHDAFLVSQKYVHGPRLHELVIGWYEQERPVYWLTPLCSPMDGDWSSFEVSDSTIHWPHIIPTLDQLPDHISTFDSRLCVYRLADTEYMPLHDLDVNFDDQIKLRGYKLYLDYGDHTVAGGKVYLVLYWEAQQDIDTDYVVFTHVLDDQSNVWGQIDEQPVGGARPTSTWKAGEIIADPILVPIQPDASPGDYELYVGLYNWPEIERLPVLNDLGQPIDERVVLETITITHSVWEISSP